MSWKTLHVVNWIALMILLFITTAGLFLVSHGQDIQALQVFTVAGIFGIVTLGSVIYNYGRYD